MVHEASRSIPDLIREHSDALRSSLRVRDGMLVLNTATRWTTRSSVTCHARTVSRSDDTLQTLQIAE